MRYDAMTSGSRKYSAATAAAADPDRHAYLYARAGARAGLPVRHAGGASHCSRTSILEVGCLTQPPYSCQDTYKLCTASLLAKKRSSFSTFLSHPDVCVHSKI
ncbi:jg14638 [Pararge aegeria aegeria]|uniref:Jg14638 protein n=1 Tax=Pararge aegeria aegeria TaxID=348720 RepID=A0A8S4RVD7_9NEOP|nr:jg14638 [Pararge aegeria aegeria]